MNLGSNKHNYCIKMNPKTILNNMVILQTVKYIFLKRFYICETTITILSYFIFLALYSELGKMFVCIVKCSNVRFIELKLNICILEHVKIVNLIVNNK